VSIVRSSRLSAEEVSIRQLAKRDLEHLFGERARHFGEKWLRRQRRSEVYVAVAEVNGLPVGRMGLDCARLSDERIAYVWSAHVVPMWQSRGIGTLLIGHLEKMACARHIDAVRLAVAKDNTRARALYERHGYAVIGEEVDRWSYRDDDDRTVEVVDNCWTMEKRLPSTN
jgi:ribosomal protein S18 acetylase RimI-like enzyme